MTAASPHCDGLRVAAPDGCTVADSVALQGFWTEAQYLAPTNGSNRLLEFTDDHIGVLPVSTQQHQAISRFLFLALCFIVRGIGGNVFYAPSHLCIREGKFREPDLLLVTDAGNPRYRNDLASSLHQGVPRKEARGFNQNEVVKPCAKRKIVVVKLNA